MRQNCVNSYNRQNSENFSVLVDHKSVMVVFMSYEMACNRPTEGEPLLEVGLWLLVA